MEERVYRVLYIEDNPVDIRYFQEIAKELRDIELEIVTATTLSRGKELLNTTKFDLIVSDLGLPDSMGLYTVKQILNEYPGLPVIVMTSINDEQLGVKAIRMGAQDYLPKGNFDSGLLARAIKYSVERSVYRAGLFSSGQAKFQALMNNIEKGAAFFDKDLVMQQSNQVFEDIFERARKGLSLEVIAGPELAEAARTAFSGRDDPVDCGIEGVAGSGFIGALRFVPVKDQAGNVLGVLCLTFEKPTVRPLIDLYRE
ncbi:MAG: response regulator [Desulfonatronovibrio sp.]